MVCKGLVSRNLFVVDKLKKLLTIYKFKKKRLKILVNEIYLSIEDFYKVKKFNLTKM